MNKNKEDNVMFTQNRYKIYYALFVLSIFFVGFQIQPAWALTSGETYTIALYKINSDGSKTQVSSTTAIADTNGKISFDLSNIPTSPTTNFIVMTITDSNGTVVRRGFAPAPPENDTNFTGINDVSTSQTNAIIQCGALTGTDDPVLIAYGLVLTRSPGISSSDIELIAQLGEGAILGTGGFEDFLLNNGVTAAQLDTFKEKLVYNDESGAKDLSDFTAKFKDAVDNDDNDAMAQAGGYMAEIFIDAAAASDIDTGLILAAHDAAGEVTYKPAYAQIVASMSSSVQKGMEQSMSSFFTRIAAMKVEADYTRALTTLNASGSQMTRYNTAVQTMISAFETIDATYSDYYMDPDTYIAEHSTTNDAVQQAMGTAYNNAFTQFQTDITSTNDEITTMRGEVEHALNMDPGSLSSSDFGTMIDFDGNTVNWPIPQTVMVRWLASIIDASGELTYTRWTDAELPAPASMSWLNGDGTRTDFTQGSPPPPASFAALQGLQEDLEIIENTRFHAADNLGPGATDMQRKSAEKAAQLAYQQHLAATVLKIGGTVDGSTAITAAQKKAMLLLLQQPSLN
jgi:hypothetical protein